MRLPALTRRQRSNEDNRVIHERIWESYLDQRPVVISLVAEQTAISLQRRLNGNLRKFWSLRGFTLHTKSLGRVLHVWVRARTGSEGPPAAVYGVRR